jgi:hypothetical protein
MFVLILLDAELYSCRNGELYAACLKQRTEASRRAMCLAYMIRRHTRDRHVCFSGCVLFCRLDLRYWDTHWILSMCLGILGEICTNFKLYSFYFGPKIENLKLRKILCTATICVEAGTDIALCQYCDDCSGWRSNHHYKFLTTRVNYTVLICGLLLLESVNCYVFFIDNGNHKTPGGNGQ